jgi:hypothetical protein
MRDILGVMASRPLYNLSDKASFLTTVDKIISSYAILSPTVGDRPGIEVFEWPWALVTGVLRPSWPSHVVFLLRLCHYPWMASRGTSASEGRGRWWLWCRVMVVIGYLRSAIPTAAPFSISRAILLGAFPSLRCHLSPPLMMVVALVIIH